MAQKAEAKTGKKGAADGVNWDRIHAEYIAGGITCAELAEKYQVSRSTLSKKATKEGWRNDREKTREKAAKKMVNRAARARDEKALKGVQLTRYISDLWTDNLKALNELIRGMPEYMLTNPSFAAGIPRGLKETYELIMEMNGRGYMNRKLANEEKRLRIEREKLELEKAKWAAQKAAMEKGLTGEGMPSWLILEDEGAEDEIGG